MTEDGVITAVAVMLVSVSAAFYLFALVLALLDLLPRRARRVAEMLYPHAPVTRDRH